MIEKFYVIGIMIISIAVVLLYIQYDKDYKMEMEKIEYLEREKEIRDRNIEHARSKTTPCPVLNLNTPRQCYINSNYTCTWNKAAERCDEK